MNNTEIKIFVGYDSKEDIAYRVCKHSINNRADKNVKVMSLKQSELIAKKYYTRSKDPLASTEFTYTRFLVPAIMKYNGWAIFCDCDFIFFKNVSEILDNIDTSKALYCVPTYVFFSGSFDFAVPAFRLTPIFVPSLKNTKISPA